ncbi:MAG: glycoside hydrolase family 5 protein [Ruminococcus sp.]|nr:glycoside hydrolase family 5 protein [Ruminococcus sp.]
MKKFKKAFLSLLLAAAVLATSACSSTGDNDSTADSDNKTVADDGVMREDLTATQVSEEMGLGLNLGNTMEAYSSSNCESIDYTWIPTIGDNTPTDYETCWGAPVTTQEMIDGIRDAGFNTVRIPVFWGNMMEDDGTYTINTDYIERVGEIVDYCRNDGLYVVINIHHFDEFIIRRNDLESCKTIFNTLWTQIAEYFKDYSDYVVFEGFNEYLGGDQFDENGTLVSVKTSDAYELTNALNQVFVDAVRATGGNNEERVLIASGYWTNIDLTTSSKFEMPTDTVDNKLMVSVHYVDNSVYWSNEIGSDWWLEYSTEQCEELKSAFTDNGIPVFIGETTSSYPISNYSSSATSTDSSQSLDTMLRLITSYGFTPVLWDTPNGVYDRDACEITSSTDAEVIATLAAELAED